jgi:hypothetical protein
LVPARGAGALAPAMSMSTRSQLRFIQTSDDPDAGCDEQVAQVYRHSDGYPASVLADLRQCKQVLAATNAYRGAGYTAAVFVFLDKLGTLEFYVGRADGVDVAHPTDLLDPAVLATPDQPLYLLGHGIEDPRTGIHGDEEYLYEIDLPKPQPFLKTQDWQIRVSEHCGFPRWEGPTEEAFDRAAWQFEGTLDEAVEAGLVDAE